MSVFHFTQSQPEPRTEKKKKLWDENCRDRGTARFASNGTQVVWRPAADVKGAVMKITRTSALKAPLCVAGERERVRWRRRAADPPPPHRRPERLRRAPLDPRRTRDDTDARAARRSGGIFGFQFPLFPVRTLRVQQVSPPAAPPEGPTPSLTLGPNSTC